MDQTLTIEVRDGVSITARRTTPDQPTADAVVIYAPGAGSDLKDPFGAYLAAFLQKQGVECWQFQFPYSEAGRRAPDPSALLEATWVAVIEAARATEAARGNLPRLVIGGRSMGGRIASMVVAKGAPVAGLALFAYPLVPPGRTTSDRADHFPDIRVPTLFCSGTRDSFGTPAQLSAAASRVSNATLHLLEGADHGFATLKASGRARQDVWQEACEALLAFMGAIPRP